MRNRWIRICLKGIALLFGVGAIIIASVWFFKYQGAANRLFAFTSTPYRAEIIGEKTVFEKGYAYRRPGLPVQVTVSGTHYEMGLQYGVLLQDEIRGVAKLLLQLGQTVARDEKIPLDFIAVEFRDAALEIADRMPQRFHDEIQGIADGSGVPVETI